MIRIGICDDQDVFRRAVIDQCKTYFENQPMEYELIAFASGEEVIDYSGETIHLLFLDVEMGEVDGIAVMEALKSNRSVWRVVFVTGHEEVMMKAFSAKTLGFVPKPVTYNAVEQYINEVLWEQKQFITLEFISGQETIYKSLEEIYYLEGEGNYAYLYEKEGRILLGQKLKYWQQKLEGTPIIRIHKSYFVNLWNVAKWEGNTVRLTNGVTLKVGRMFAEEARKQYLNFIKQKAFSKI